MERRVIAFALGADVTDGVRERVSSQIAVASKHFTTRRALVRFEVGVREEVSLEIGSLIEAARTDGAFVRRLFQMQNPVDGQRSRLAKAFAAIATFKRLLLRVDVTNEKRKEEKRQILNPIWNLL